MLIIRVDEGEALPLARSGYCRVLVTEFSGLQHVVFVNAGFGRLYRGHSDIIKLLKAIRLHMPGLTMRKVEML